MPSKVIYCYLDFITASFFLYYVLYSILIYYHETLFIPFIFLLRISFSEDYILQFQAKVKNLKELNISETKKFRNYDLEGTFTDNYGSIGIFNAITISDVENGKLIRLDSMSENIDSNNEKNFLRGIREKNDVDASIAYNTIIGTTKNLVP